MRNSLKHKFIIPDCSNAFLLTKNVVFSSSTTVSSYPIRSVGVKNNAARRIALPKEAITSSTDASPKIAWIISVSPSISALCFAFHDLYHLLQSA